MSSTLRHRKTSSEPLSPNPNLSPPPLRVPLMDQSSSRQVQVTALSLTSLLTTLTTTEGITTTARKLYTYPTKRLSSSDLFRRSRSDDGVVISTSGSSGAITPPLSLSLAEPANSSYRRHLYLDSLTYLLRALPSDLSPSETTQLISCLPPAVVESLEPLPSAEGSIPQQRVYEHPTIHYFLLVLTATTVSSIRNLTPHLKSLAQSTWEYNLKYRVAERSYDKVRRTVDSGFAFWKAVAEWVMFDDRSCNTGENEGAVVVNGRKLRYGGGVVKDVGKYAGGVIRSGVGGMVEGFVEGMKA